MKFSIGDKVLLKATGEEGIVVAYLSELMLEVDVQGITFPVYASDVDHPYLKWFTEQKQRKPSVRRTDEPLPPEPLPKREQRQAQGIYLAFLPVESPGNEEGLVDHLKVYLLNETPAPVYFRYAMRIAGNACFTHEAKLAAYGNIYLHQVPYADMNDRPRFHWTVSAGDAGSGLRERSGVIHIRPSRLAAEIHTLNMNREAMFSYLLAKDFEETFRAPDIPPSLPRPRKKAPAPHLTSGHFRELPRYELDLHIEKIAGNTRGLSNAEMLRMQLDYLQYYLQLAVVHRMDSMIVIHGLGRGVLRDAVHNLLRETPEVGDFANEWIGGYGFGATRITFRY